MDSPKLPEPSAVIYPDSGFRNDSAGLWLWEQHGYDTGGSPLFTAEQMLSMYRQGMERAAEIAASFRSNDKAVNLTAREIITGEVTDDISAAIRSEAKGGKP